MKDTSYSRNGEDKILLAVFADVRNGFYIDVGAFKPDLDSNTYALYQRGWHGLAIDPLIGLAPELAQQWHELRPRDHTVGAMAAATTGSRKFWMCNAVQMSTGSQSLIELYRADGGFISAPAMVPAFTLNEMLVRFAGVCPQLLNLDVEAMEGEVLAGLDLKRCRPWVLVVEVRRPCQEDLTTEFEPRLFAHDYRLVHSDVCNRFYLAKEHDELAVRFPLLTRVN